MIIIILLLAFGIGIFAFHLYASYCFNQAQEALVYYTVLPKLERIEDTVYAHDQNGDFIGQGKSKNELITSILLNLPTKTIYMDRAELEKVGF